jgi:hypothetical protein
MLRRYMKARKLGAGDIADIAKVHVSAVYRWLEEEDDLGFIRSISAEALANLHAGTKGKLNASQMIGAAASL